MSGWIVWLVVACAFGVGELLTTGFFLGPFAIGGLLAAVTDAAGGGEAAAAVVFVVVSIMTLLLLRPIVQSRIMHSSPTLRTGAAALIGKQAIVLERIANDEGVGMRADRRRGLDRPRLRRGERDRSRDAGRDDRDQGRDGARHASERGLAWSCNRRGRGRGLPRHLVRPDDPDRAAGPCRDRRAARPLPPHAEPGNDRC